MGIGADADHEVADVVDLDRRARPDQHGCRLLLDQKRTARRHSTLKVRTEKDRRVEPAVLTVPYLAVLGRTGGAADPGLRGGRDRPGRGSRHDSGRGKHDGAVCLDVAVEPLILLLEHSADGGLVENAGFKAGRFKAGRFKTFEAVDADPYRPQLPGVMQVELVGQFDVAAGESLRLERRACLDCEIAERRQDPFGLDGVERASQESLEVLADVGVQHADRTQCAGGTRHIDP